MLKVNKSLRSTLTWLLVTIMIVTLVIPLGISAIAGNANIEIIESAGELESAYVEWSAVTNATGYNVYFKAADANDSAYIQLDDMLVRQYSGYFRADQVGLAAGNYVMKVVPIMNGSESATNATVTGTLTVGAYDRTGFAWKNGTASGAYNEDGTLKHNADIIYVTESTKDTVKLDVVTNAKGTTTAATGLQNILVLVKKGYANPISIRLIGNITDLSSMNNGDILIDGGQKGNTNGVTFEGIGEDATVNGWGLRIKGATNVEVRNLGFMNCDSGEGDNVGLQQANDHVWVHNCDLFYGDTGSDADQVKGDGAMDCKKSTYVTLSYNHFWDSGKCNLLGLSGENDEMYITYHHNWYDHSDSRHPRVRYYSAHVYNNYYDGNAKYGIGACLASSVLSENNYFRNCKYPMLISNQGSDYMTGDDKKGTFSGENGGMIKSVGNVMSGNYTFVDQNISSTQFDAISVSNRSDKISSAYVTLNGGTTYNNFDTDSSIMYSYTADTAQVAKENVINYAGRVNGGDFQWKFENSVDDELSEVNASLKNALTNYTTKLVRVGGLSDSSENSTTEATTEAITEVQTEATTAVQTEAVTQVTTEATTQATTNIYYANCANSYFTVAGSLTKNGGDQSIVGTTYSQALKFDSKGKITFTTTQEKAKVTVYVIGKKSNASLKISGPLSTTIKGIGTTKLSKQTVTIGEAGTYVISQNKNETYVYYVVVEEGNTGSSETQPTSTTETTSATTSTTSTTATTTESTTSSGGSSSDVTLESDTGLYTNLSKMSDANFANVVYVAPKASATGTGTKEDPKDLQSAINGATKGQTIMLLDGTYSYDSQITIGYGNNGTADAYKVLRASDGASVKLDFSSQAYGDTSTNKRGLQIEGNYWYVDGITVYGSADNGIFVAGNNNVIERCVLQANRDTGLQISRRLSSLSNMADWPCNNTIINCTSFDNCDPATGENADGFAAKLTCGAGNVFDGCIAYCNCDDGWDLYAKEATGSIGVVTIRNCIAFHNGTLTNGNSEANGDMNGFKLGGSNGKVSTAHIVFNCLAFNNGKDGFTDNGNGGKLSLTNCTSYGNKKSNFNFYRTTAGGTFINLFSANTTATDKFIGTLFNSVYCNSSKFYSITGVIPVTVASGDKTGTIISAPTNSNFVNVTAPSVSSNIDLEMRATDGTISTTYLQTTGNYSIMGARFGVSTAELKLNTIK